MSDSEDSTVTYTAVSSPFEDGSDIGSPGVDGPPIMPEDPYAYIMAAYQVPPSPDYIPGPEEPQSPPPLDFVPEPMYPEYIPQEDEILPAEEQPLPAAASPTADSPGYVPESDPEEEPEEDDEDPEEDPADYPADRDDDDDDEDEDEEEEEEHPAPADSVPPVHRMTARISIRDEPSISLPPREEVERLLALTTLPPSPLTPLSSPLPHIPSPPFPASPPASPIRLLGYRAAMIRLRAETPSTSHPLPLPTSSPLFSAVAATRPVGGRRADYGFVGTMDTEIRRRRAKEGDRAYCSPGAGHARYLCCDRGYSGQANPDISECWTMTVDRKSQVVTLEMLQAYYQRQVQLTKALELLKIQQTQMAEFQRQLRPAKDPAQPDAPGEAGSSS
ncbi:hypothetical protein Tco_1056127 [Tanacetum coccineum]|uniref:Uncharacterized protein n=1 Tax=Tanacetum coccineum TaxID=301880 RepID=A0ABQ5H1M5_9ASTR